MFNQGEFFEHESKTEERLFGSNKKNRCQISDILNTFHKILCERNKPKEEISSLAYFVSPICVGRFHQFPGEKNNFQVELSGRKSHQGGIQFPLPAILYLPKNVLEK